ncbi:glycogen/starch synthase, partial [Akkermansiaceae bacterium]|nr:glycogen/starch synthase [Akkermansiaceae bacterium]
MSSKRKKPTILVVTPEITYLPKGMGNAAQRLSAKAGGMADVSASLVNALYEQGADVHVALPNFRRMFNLEEQNVYEAEYHEAEKALPEQHIHLAQDRIFFHRSRVYSAKDN